MTKYSQTTYLADFRSYTEQGFMISPSSSGFIYESVGDISTEFIIGKKEGYSNSKAEFGQEHLFVPTYDYMTAELVKEAKSLGADALLNYRVRPILERNKYGMRIIGYTANGFAVKLIKK